MRGSYGGVTGEEGCLEDMDYEVLKIFGWQDKGVVALVKVRTTEEDRGE